MADVADATRRPFAPLADAVRDLSAAEKALRAEQQAAWQRYLAEVDRILAADLHVSEEPEHLDAIAHHLVDGLRARVDDLRVQAKLGAMEGEDLVTQLRSALGQLADRVHLPGR